MLCSDAFPFGFRIVGGTYNERRLVDWSAAFVAHLHCDLQAEVSREAYLSAFCFGDDFKHQLAATGSTRGFDGATWSPWLWFDLDRDELEQATNDARRLAAHIVEAFGIDDDELLAFFSGRKGYHIGAPLAACGPLTPSPVFHRVCRRMAERIALGASVRIDCGVYDRVRAFRAPNSRHPKTGLHKRPLSVGELLHLAPSRLVQLASDPQPVDLPDPPQRTTDASRCWAEAAAEVQAERDAAAERKRNGTTPETLNRSTLDFLRDGAIEGDRHRLLFSAAANLGEFGCPAELAHALLREPALDSGLPPREVRRQIDLGLNHGRGN